MSLLHNLANPHMGHGFQLSLLCGVVSSSYFFCGNLGAAFFGILPAIQDTHSVRVNLSAAQKVELWKWFYDRGKIHFSISTIVSAISFTTAATLCSSSSLRKLLLSAAAMSFTVAPYTIFAMMPINDELMGMVKDRSLEDSDQVPKSTALVQERAATLIERWKQLHRVRLALGLGGWIGGLVAFVSAL